MEFAGSCEVGHRVVDLDHGFEDINFGREIHSMLGHGVRAFFLLLFFFFFFFSPDKYSPTLQKFQLMFV